MLSCASSPAGTARWLWARSDDKLAPAFKDLDQIYTDYELGTIGRDELLEIVPIVTSYVFRRAVCRIPTNSLNKTFAGFGTALRKDRYVDSVVANFLGMKSYRAFPTDAEFKAAMVSTDLNKDW